MALIGDRPQIGSTRWNWGRAYIAVITPAIFSIALTPR